jgi:hypothetical protein
MRLIFVCLFFVSALSFAKDIKSAISVEKFTANMQHQVGFFDFYYQVETDKVLVPMILV